MIKLLQPFCQKQRAIGKYRMLILLLLIGINTAEAKLKTDQILNTRITLKLKNAMGYSIAHNSILIGKKQLSEDAAQQQDHTVRGQVTDSKGAPLTGVSVLIKSTKIGATTNENGMYSLILPNGN